MSEDTFHFTLKECYITDGSLTGYQISYRVINGRRKYTFHNFSRNVKIE